MILVIQPETADPLLHTGKKKTGDIAFGDVPKGVREKYKKVIAMGFIVFRLFQQIRKP